MTPDTPETMIYEALSAHLQDLDTGLPVFWPEVRKNELPADRKYLAVYYMPADTVRIGIGSDGPHRFTGVYQITVGWPINEGILEPMRIAGLVAEHFGADVKMNYGGITVRSTKRPTVAGSYHDQMDLLTPVSVVYESYI